MRKFEYQTYNTRDSKKKKGGGRGKKGKGENKKGGERHNA